jgi:hypothetical protein
MPFIHSDTQGKTALIELQFLAASIRSHRCRRAIAYENNQVAAPQARCPLPEEGNRI